MEQIHGVDVSWMAHGSPKDKAIKTAARRRSLSQTARDSTIPTASPPPASPIPQAATNGTQTDVSPNAATARPPLSRTSSDEKRTPPAPQRRGSWFSNISSKFSSGSTASQSPPQANTASPKPAELSVPRANPVKNAVLQHATKHEGEGPYTPAPPRSSQAGILHVFRRLSSSNGNLSPSVKPNNHGLVERRVLNVDQHRERCRIAGLNQAKLRRVAFCVDVEVAPMPKYLDGDTGKKLTAKMDRADKDQKRKIKEKGEGEALKNAKAAGSQSSENGQTTITGEALSQEPAAVGTDPAESTEQLRKDVPNPEKAADKADSKKKEKKKKSEEERKARKEKKRKLAEANGTIPMELHLDSGDDSSSSNTVPPPEHPRTQAMPTTNPVRIYRRCCQLRETPILKKITEQLNDPKNSPPDAGMVEKLDLTGYWMQLPDLVTLGDYLAVVPVREVIMENCGLTDEGLRVILAGLLAVKKPAAARKRRTLTEPDGLVQQGGVVEKLVLKNNKLGPEGWRHICLFIYLCRTLKCLDLTGISFPRPPNSNPRASQTGIRPEQDVSQLLSKSLGERLGGPTISLINLGQTGLNTEQLGTVIDGMIKCRLKRLCLAHNDIDPEGLEHVARFVSSGVCEGLDLGGNDLRDQLAAISEAVVVSEDNPLWALGLADCNLKPSSLCKLLPTLVKLPHFRFIDLSHNHDLFSSDPSAISVLRRYLPKMQCLKRIHLADCSMSPEQVIALAEILPEIPGLAHISFLENPELVELATNATTDETKEEACALYASLLAAARVSSSLVAVDIEVPSEQSSDLVKAMAKHVVAYCLRNMELAAVKETDACDVPEPEYPEALQRLVGHDAMKPSDLDGDLDAAPDEDYVIGGTGLVKALACCLKNRGDDESRRQSGEFIRDVENGIPASQRRPAGLPGGKAKETSKHLLSTARKIRHRLQPAMVKARSLGGDTHTYHRLNFLDNTLQGIIKRFEDEFPDTREEADSAIGLSSSYEGNEKHLSASLSSAEGEGDALARHATAISDGEDDGVADNEIRPPLNRSNSMISLSSKALANEEGRVLRAGHKFRAGIVKPEHYALLAGVELVGRDPNHVRMLHEMLDELGDEEVKKEAEEKGIIKVFEERKGEIINRLRELDPAHWDRFVESQVMARKNVEVGQGDGPGEEAVVD